MSSKGRRFLLLLPVLWSVLGFAPGCTPMDDTANDSDVDDVQDGLVGSSGPSTFFESCETAPDHGAATACSGPDSFGWSNQGRPADAGLCPDPPDGGCTQVVLGRLPDTRGYIDCPGYIVLNRSDWSIALNDRFIACAATCNLGTCDSPIIVVSTSDDIPDFNDDHTLTSVTSRELCELHNSGCTVTMADEQELGYVDCGCSG